MMRLHSFLYLIFYVEFVLYLFQFHGLLILGLLDFGVERCIILSLYIFLFNIQNLQFMAVILGDKNMSSCIYLSIY